MAEFDNNIDNKGYWENPVSGLTNSSSIDKSLQEIIELLKKEFDDVKVTLEEIRDNVKTNNNVENNNLDEEIKNNDITTEISENNNSKEETLVQEEQNLDTKPELSTTKIDENILPISDILQTSSVEESTNNEEENIVPIELPILGNKEEVQEAPAMVTKPVAPVTENISPLVETPIQEAPAMVKEPLVPVTENISPLVETPVQEAPAMVTEPVVPVTENISPVVETPVQEEVIDTIEIIPLTFDSAKITPIDPNLKTAQRTDILTQQQNEILKGKSINNVNATSFSEKTKELNLTA